MNRKFFILFIFFTVQFNAKNASNTAKSILDEMIDATAKISTCSYKLHTIERINGRFEEINSQIKINTFPRKVYLYNPTKKLEVLYLEGENNNNAMVNPGKFPYITLNLKPHNNLMRKNQHHSIDDLGFQFIAEMIKNSINSNNQPFEKTFVYTGNIDWDGKKCFKIYCDFKDFKYINYTAPKNENIVEISKKMGCGEYRIVEKNKLEYDDIVKKGTTLKIPNLYSNKTLIYIDIASKLPVMIKIFDDEGLFEMYEFTDIHINKTFAKNEFSKSFKAYNFK